MAKYQEVFEDTQDLFTKLIAKTDLERIINIKILANNTLKEIGKVIKANDLVKHMTSEDVIILLNEKVFEKLTPEQKTMVAEDLLAPISYDNEKGKLVISKPDVQAFSLLLRKYGWNQYEALLLSIKSIYKQMQDAADAAANLKTKTKKLVTR